MKGAGWHCSSPGLSTPQKISRRCWPTAPRRWGRRSPGAPGCDALSRNLPKELKTILHRKNAMFYKTGNGAHVGDLFMSLIHTCQLCGANPFDYLTTLQRHAEELRPNPQNWMPWNYREMLEPADTPQHAARG